MAQSRRLRSGFNYVKVNRKLIPFLSSHSSYLANVPIMLSTQRACAITQKVTKTVRAIVIGPTEFKQVGGLNDPSNDDTCLGDGLLLAGSGCNHTPGAQITKQQLPPSPCHPLPHVLLLPGNINIKRNRDKLILPGPRSTCSPMQCSWTL